MAFRAILPLFFSTPIEFGGLGLPPSTIGVVLGSFGVMDGIFQALFFSKLVDRWGPKRVFQVGMSMFIILYLLFPIMNVIARKDGMSNSVWALVILQLALSVIMDMAYGMLPYNLRLRFFAKYAPMIGCSFIFITGAAVNKKSIGATNGIGQLAASVVRAIAPAGATSLFALSLDHNWLGGHGVYAIFTALSCLCMLVGVPLPVRGWVREEDDSDY